VTGSRVRLVTAFALAVLPGCAQEPTSGPASPPISTPSPSPTQTATPETSPSPTEEATAEAYPYGGYPKVVKSDRVPSQMRDYIDGPQAVAVARGVWTQRIPGVNLLESASHGAFIGYCAAVEKAIKKLNNDSGYTCW
jgi:hypothetical protein